MKNKLLILLALLLFSCNTTKRATKLIDKAARIDESAVAKACADRYPIKESIKIQTEYIKGKTDTLPPTYITINCDSLKAAAEKNKSKETGKFYIPLPPSTKQVDTLKKTEEKTQEQTSKIRELTLKNTKLTADLAVSDKQNKTKGTWLLILASYMIIKTILRLIFPKLSFILNKLP